MSSDRDQHVAELAELYRKHFDAGDFKEASEALAAAEAYQRQLAAAHGEDYATLVDRAAYRIGHG